MLGAPSRAGGEGSSCESLLSTFPTLGEPQGIRSCCARSVPLKLNSFVGGSRLQTRLLAVAGAS